MMRLLAREAIELAQDLFVMVPKLKHTLPTALRTLRQRRATGASAGPGPLSRRTALFDQGG